MALVVAEFNQTGLAYRALQILDSDFSNQAGVIQFLEMFPRGRAHIFLASGDKESLEKFAKKLQGPDSLIQILSHWSQQTEQTFYSLSNKPVGAKLHIIESEDLYEIFSVAEQGIALGLDLIDLKADRTGLGRHICYLSEQENTTHNIEKELALRASLKKIIYTQISNPGALVRSYFS